jgi:DinB superfamily
MAKSVMPIPAAADAQDATSTVLTLFRQLHEQLREDVSGLDADALNWVPTAGANSIATIITHIIGSEAETLRSLADLPCERDREAEFRCGECSLDQIRPLLDEADVLLAVVKPQIGVERLESRISLPTRPPEEARSGLAWLVGNYGHAREHLGHVQLTRQLYESRTMPGPGHSSASE